MSLTFTRKSGESFWVDKLRITVEVLRGRIAVHCDGPREIIVRRDEVPDRTQQKEFRS
jgi:sRNA-binding carbon storage regulator CsrA